MNFQNVHVFKKEKYSACISKNQKNKNLVGEMEN